MPIFEYTCEDCGTKFEKLLRRSGDEVACPSCGEHHLRTEYSTFAARANGSPKSAQESFPSCPGGMCQTPGLCGRN
jgi:putative FmdB family regulatory protein